MAKLVIIDDNLPVVDKVAAQMKMINNAFNEENSYYLYKKDNNMHFRKIKERDTDICNLITFTHNDKLEILQLIDNFIKETDEKILILFDVLLISQNIYSPNIEDYEADGEFSIDIYSHLIELKNGKNTDLNTDNLFFIIYSRSDTTISMLSFLLKQRIREENKKNTGQKDNSFLPIESAEEYNISWVYNLYADPKKPPEKDVGNEFPLSFPIEYINFIKEF